MKKSIFILFSVSLCALFVISCGKKTNKNKSDESSIESEFQHTVSITETHFDNNWNKLQDKQVLSEAEYNDLKLGSLSFIDKYDELEYEIGSILIEEENRKLLSIKAITSGEISEYLLGYIDNNVTDSLLIAYEDVVEYYSTTSSIIADNKIEVLTVNWDYSGMKEISDTIKTVYLITNDLKFDEIID